MEHAILVWFQRFSRPSFELFVRESTMERLGFLFSFCLNLSNLYEKIVHLVFVREILISF